MSMVRRMPATAVLSPDRVGRPVLAACLLGELTAAVDGHQVPLGSSRRTRAVLAFLIDRGDRPSPRDLLMETFWPSSPPDAARNSVHVAVSAARKALARAWAGTVIESRGDVYRIADEVELWTDVAAFERCCALGAAAHAAGDADGAMAHLEAAADLYRGEFLAEDPYLEWAHERREELRLLAVTCAERLSELHLERGDLQRTLLASSQVLREEPCHEPVARRLMVAYARLGQPHMALRHYERIVDVLDRELGVCPAPETVTLADGIRRRVPV
jgi:DNA-binding SARP family transcriptional activator